jgi:hypothetical protein
VTLASPVSIKNIVSPCKKIGAEFRRHRGLSSATKKKMDHEVIHELRSLTENENAAIFLGTFFPRVVIPAYAGIQVCSSPQLAWIPAFAGMTKPCGYLAYSRFFYR